MQRRPGVTKRPMVGVRAILKQVVDDFLAIFFNGVEKRCVGLKTLCVAFQVDVAGLLQFLEIFNVPVFDAVEKFGREFRVRVPAN